MNNKEWWEVDREENDEVSDEEKFLKEKIGKGVEVYKWIKRSLKNPEIWVKDVWIENPFIGMDARLTFHYADFKHPCTRIDSALGYSTEFEFKNIKPEECDFIHNSFYLDEEGEKRIKEFNTFPLEENFIHFEWLEE